MLAALCDLDRQIGKGKLARFHVRNGYPDTELLKAIPDLRAVFFNSDITPFAVARDDAIAKWCQRNNVHVDGGDHGEGYLLWPAGSILTKSGGTVPKTFSAFYRYTQKKVIVTNPDERGKPPLAMIELSTDKFDPDVALRDAWCSASASSTQVPTCDSVMRRLESGAFDNYGETRDDYQIPTTRLSVHMKFGRVDPVKVMTIARKRGIDALQRQLLWREFYYHLASGYPDTLTAPNAHIRPDRNRVRWNPVDEKKAEAWLEGRTGEPLVDQAMQELKRSGYLHNRLRMVVSSYFVRDMGLDWREGERLLATRLVDYDPAQNSGGWQAADAQVPGQEIKAATQLRKYGHLKTRQES